jgi:CspA family cold shock protein
MATGRVKFYDAKQGFGYLSPDNGGPDVYVGKAALAAGVNGLGSGKRVEFEVSEGPRGPQAHSVRPLTGRPADSVAAARRSAGELDALITELIGLLDTTVLPELRQGRYPDRAPSKVAAEMARTLIHELDATADEPPEPRRIPAHSRTSSGRRAPAPRRSSPGR